MGSDDVMLLFASQASTTALTGPGTGWAQVGRVVDTGHATTVWRRVATGSDPGSTVRLATSGGVYTKVALTLAAYRGVDPDAPARLDHGCSRGRQLDRAHDASGVEHDFGLLAGVVLV